MTSSDSAGPPAQPPAPPVESPRLGLISGDRACIKCGFNLYGQPITREPHYGLIIARCPECGTPAALQEYPLLGRWPRRFAALLTMLWLGTLLVLLIMTLAAMSGIAGEAHAAALRPLSLAISKAHAEHQRQLPQSQGITYPWNEHEYAWVDPMWASRTDRAPILADAASRLGVAGPVDPRSYIDWPSALHHVTLGAVFALLLGLLWGVALLHIPRRRIGLAAVPILALAAAASLLSVGPSGAYYARQVAQEWAGMSRYWVLLALLIVPLAAGMVLGRPAARLLIRFLLPPRLRIPLSVLWTADNLPPPRR